MMEAENSESILTDLLQLYAQPRLVALLGHSQKIIGSCEIQIITNPNKSNKKFILVTNRGVYIVARCHNIIKSVVSKLVSMNTKFIVKQKIQYGDILAITLKNITDSLQFWLHLQNWEDVGCALGTEELKIKLIRSICQQFQRHTQRKLAIYFTNKEMSLKNKEKLKKVKKSLDERVFEGFAVYSEEAFGVEFRQLMSWNNQNCEIDRFRSITPFKFQQNHQYFMIKKVKCEFQTISHKLSLKHPFITQPSYVYQAGPILYMLYPLHLGGRLDKFVQRQWPINPEFVKLIISQIICAIEYLHANFWVYCNLSLDKMYLDVEGNVAIMGMERCIRKKKFSEEKLFSFVGKPVCMAPQMIYCQGYDESIDIWHLGVCFYTILKNHHPFTAKSSKQSLKKCLQHPIDSQKEFIPEFVCQMLQKNPYNRITLQQIKSNSYFDGINWNKLLEKQIEPPIVYNLAPEGQWKETSIVYIQH